MDQHFDWDDEKMVVDANESESDSFAQGLTMKQLNMENRKIALAEYGRIYRETKAIDMDKDKRSFGEILTRLNSTVYEGNFVLSRFGVNELLSLDAKNMALASELSLDLTKKLKIVEKFDSSLFARRLRFAFLKNFMKSNLHEIDPKKQLYKVHLYPTGKAFNKLKYETRTIGESFNVKFNPSEINVRNFTQRTQRLPSGKTTKPIEYDSSKNVNSVDESDKRLNYIYNSLRKLEKLNVGGVPMIQATFNPKDYATTIENIFNMAFLVRQSRVIIDSDLNSTGTDCDPIVLTKEPDNDDVQDNDEDDDQEEIENQREKDVNDNKTRIPVDKINVQSVFSLDMDIYHKLINKFEIERPAFH